MLLDIDIRKERQVIARTHRRKYNSHALSQQSLVVNQGISHWRVPLGGGSGNRAYTGFGARAKLSQELAAFFPLCLRMCSYLEFSVLFCKMGIELMLFRSSWRGNEINYVTVQTHFLAEAGIRNLLVHVFHPNPIPQAIPYKFIMYSITLIITLGLWNAPLVSCFRKPENTLLPFLFQERPAVEASKFIS